MKTYQERERRRRVWPCRFLLSIVFCLLLLGCSDGRVVVKGEVSVNGKPADEGTINFAPMDGQGPSMGGKIEHGQYALEAAGGVMPGKKRVIISAFQKTGRRIPAGMPLPPGTMIDEILVLPDLSELNKDVLLNVEVVAGKINVHNFDLKTKK